MVLIRLVSALAAASTLLGAAAQSENPLLTASPSPTVVATSITTPTTTKPAKEQVSIGCFATRTPLVSYGTYDFQSPGNCQLVCLQEDKDVFAVSDGNTCWCGDKIPPKMAQVDDSYCDTDCSGTDKVKCGGPNLLWVVLTGLSLNRVDYLPDPVSSSSATPSSAAAATSAVPVKTSTPTPSRAPPKEEESKPNTVGIAVGAVVGVVGLAAIIGGVFFFLRRRRQKQAEEDYRRNAANVDQFVAGGKLHTSNSSINDSRIDPSFGDRRQSNGSIADNEDYSRRILKVTNV